ncbi:type VI secretion system baseplate subunit TssE [Algicola sagamiensis]|uniref:type VI secretion system baseplate subunit TssE n=1 Tax=Algicola sagamiensis TaxID=163869 RepID=UPI00035CA562|nr:type VI secretion system baseplate subunit TssE [Algicola sagamiensis]
MRARSEHQVQPSILDRLLDNDPENQTVPLRQPGVNIRQLRASVKRDLEALLNSRIHWHTWPEEYEELSTSTLTYGLPDFSTMQVSSSEGREQLCEYVRVALLRFEPRFMEVEVTIPDESLPLDRIMRLKISAILFADPDPEFISFDSEVEPVNLTMKIKESRV